MSQSAKPWDHAAGCLVVAEAGGRILSGGVPGYDPRAPRAPVIAFADAESPGELLPEALLKD